LTALETIMKEWLRTDLTFQQRIDYIESGGDPNEPYLLNPSTVSSNGGQNTLTGGGGHNWFFANQQRDTIKNFKKGDQLIPL
jgi:hypothetical protein